MKEKGKRGKREKRADRRRKEKEKREGRKGWVEKEGKKMLREEKGGGPQLGPGGRKG